MRALVYARAAAQLGIVSSALDLSSSWISHYLSSNRSFVLSVSLALLVRVRPGTEVRVRVPVRDGTGTCCACASPHLSYSYFRTFVCSFPEQPDARGGELFEKVCNHLNLGEKDYFSMTFWLDKEVRLAATCDVTVCSPLHYSTTVLSFGVHTKYSTVLSFGVHSLSVAPFHICSSLSLSR